jgi:adenine deaminase
MRQKAQDTSPERLARRVGAAQGKQPADLVIKNVRILDVFCGEFYYGDIAVCGDLIVGVGESYDGATVIDGTGKFLVPGFIDAHAHVESSMLTPARFQEMVLPRGTTTVVWDPHEIANVLGHEGIEWALARARELTLDLFVMLPSCVPATHLETSGAELTTQDLERYRYEKGVLGLAEFMNYPGVLFGDPEVARKLSTFADMTRDGHAPMLRGRDLSAYLTAGIHTCHECTSLEEGREKLRKGMHLLIREGSCAKDAATLLPLINPLTSAILALCSDDRNPLDVAAEGHVNHIIEMGLKRGIAPELLFRVASFGAAQIYGLRDRGVLAPGFRADFCLVSPSVEGDWKRGFAVESVVKSGQMVKSDALAAFAEASVERDRPKRSKPNINMPRLTADKLKLQAPLSASGEVVCRVIRVVPGKIITHEEIIPLALDARGCVEADAARDVAKLAVVERHRCTGNVAVGFVAGFGLRDGAIAASIGHDSHNITVVGLSDEAMVAAVRAVQTQDGGIAVVDGKGQLMASLPLPVGGLMTDASPSAVEESLRRLKQAAQTLGCTLDEPFLQLSFLALPVIPDLKITDKGLVDVRQFNFVSPLV